MSDYDKARQLIEDASETVAARYVEGFESLAVRCESPIERLFLAGFINGVEFSGIRDQVEFTKAEFVYGQPRRHPWERADLLIQATVGPYRVDFLIDDGIDHEFRHYIVIECDGHDFHERTKEQARKDKARDRYFAALGIKVLHFTGSELFADAEKCADEVIEHLTFQKYGPSGENDGGRR